MPSSASSSDTFLATLVDELRAISDGLVYEPVGTGGAESAPLERELRVIESALQARRHAPIATRGALRLSRERALLRALERADENAPGSGPATGRGSWLRAPSLSEHRVGPGSSFGTPHLSVAEAGRAPRSAMGSRRPALLRAPDLDERSARAMLARANAIDRDTRAAIRRIERNRRFRDTPMPTGSTLYQSVDEPALARLRDLQHRSQRVAAELRRRFAEGAFSGTATGGWAVRPRQPLRETTRASRADSPYPAASGTPRPQGVPRPLSALYERWVMLRVVEALRDAGLEGGSMHDALIRDERKGYWRDFDDEAAVTFTGTQDRIVRVRFEPWIHPRNVAIMQGEGLYRAGDALHSWRPDIVIQIDDAARPALEHRGVGLPAVRACIIIDAKLAPVLRMTHWQQVQKYRFVRASANDARVVRNLFIASPAGRTQLPPEASTDAASPEILVLSPQPARRAETAAALRRLAANVLALL